MLMLRRLALISLLTMFGACAAPVGRGDGGDGSDGRSGDGSGGDGSGGDGLGGDGTGGETSDDTGSADADDAVADTGGGEGGGDATGGDVVATDTTGIDVVGTDVVGTDIVGTDIVGTDVVATDVVTTDVVGTDVVSTDVVVTDTGPTCPTPTRACYSGPAGTAGMGVCRNGVQMCIAGAYGTCTGEITPTAEACNGLDDNCNGTADEGLGNLSCGIGFCRVTVAACAAGRAGTCTPGAPRAEICGNMIDDDCNGAVDNGCGCTYVSTTGNDGSGTGAATAPYRTIQNAILQAGTGGRASVVCVAGGDYPENVIMRNGISVFGGYLQAATPWTRPGMLTRILPTVDRGVQFGPTVAMATVLDGFTVNAASTPTNAAITVDGSAGAIIINDIVNGGAGTISVGINVTSTGLAAATPQIRNNLVTGGSGSASAIGVDSTASAPVIQANCSAFDAVGRCTAGCGGARGLRGRPGAATTGLSFGVRLVNSPNSSIDSSGVCSGPGADVAGVRINGNAAGVVVRASNIGSFGGTVNAVGLWADACAGASPWVVNNFLISGNSPTLGARADGVRAVGACHPVIDSNVRIIGGIESANNDANGVLCAADSAGVASRCTVLNNTTIQGSGGGFPPNATGVRCENGSCIRIDGNALITGMSGMNSFGVTLINTGAVVTRNQIEAGCGQREGTGVRSENSYARVDDNLIFGNRCAATGVASMGDSWGVRVFNATGANEIDLHSNDIFGEGPLFVGPVCTSRGISFDVLPGGAPPTGPRGIVRNNIVHPGRCPTRFGIQEASALADPRLLQNNDVWFQAAGDTLYRDENATNLATIAAVNALADITSMANLSADPVFVGSPNLRLQMTSPCINSGSAAGAPILDFYGVARPRGGAYEIGAAEF